MTGSKASDRARGRCRSRRVSGRRAIGSGGVVSDPREPVRTTGYDLIVDLLGPPSLSNQEGGGTDGAATIEHVT